MTEDTKQPVDVADELVSFAVGELFGPCCCEHDGCSNASWLIWMTPEEYADAKTQDQVHPANYIFSKVIGRALCEDHRPEAAV